MINLLFCGNHVVFDGFLTCLLSAIKRSEGNDAFNVFIFTMDVSRINPRYTPITDVQMEVLDKTLKESNSESKITKIDVTDLYEEHFKECPNEGAYCSPYTLIRLFADMVDGLPDKILYLDADIMCNRDVKLLFDIDVENVEYAAARDHYGKFLIHPNYINAGVILLNLKKCKETGLFDKARAWIKKKKLVFADQSAIIRSTTKKKVISAKFNNQKYLRKNTVIRHFSKRLFWLPYPHTANIKQWEIEKVKKKFKYNQFDDIYETFLEIKKNNNM